MRASTGPLFALLVSGLATLTALGCAHRGEPISPEIAQQPARTSSNERHGSLSREVIRRVIRSHVNEVRFCYEQALAADPQLTGRVTVSFVIAADGHVQVAAVSSSTLGAPAVEACMVRAVRTWPFPAPEGGGVVGVNYPFTLLPDGGDLSTDESQ